MEVPREAQARGVTAGGADLHDLMDRDGPISSQQNLADQAARAREYLRLARNRRLRPRTKFALGYRDRFVGRPIAQAI